MKKLLRTSLAVTAAGVVAFVAGCAGSTDEADTGSGSGDSASGENIAVTLWRPHWAYDAYDLKDLEDPEGTLGATESIYSYSRAGFADDHPQVNEWLSNFEMSSDLLYSLENAMFSDSNTESSEYPTIVDSWLAENEAYADQLTDASDVGGDAEEITIAVFNGWPEGEAVSYLWQALLEDAGYTVNLEYADAAPVFVGLAGGDYDVTLDVWLPVTHEAYIEQYGEDVVELGAWNAEAVLTIAVNADAPIDSLEELAENADLFDNTIYGIEPGAGLTRAVEESVIPTYGLEDMNFQTSSTPAMLTELERALG